MSETKIIDLKFTEAYAFMLMGFSSLDCNSKVCWNESPSLPNSERGAAGELERMVQVHQTSSIPFNTPSPQLKLALRRGNADLKRECNFYFSLRGPFFRPQ